MGMNLNGNNIYARGYIVSNEELELPSGLSWSMSNVGGYIFYTHSKRLSTFGRRVQRMSLLLV